MKRKLLVVVAAVLCVAMLFIGCSSNTPAASSAAAESAAPASSEAAAPASSDAAAPAADSDISGKTIGYVLSGPDLYYEQSYQVFEALAKEVGWTITKTTSDYDPKKETNNVQDMIAKKVDVIVLNDVTESNGAACAKLANDANIPIFFITTLPDPNGVGKPTASCSGPWYQVGVENAKWLMTKVENKEDPKFVLIEGAYGQGTVELIRLGFLTELSEELGKTPQQVFDENVIFNQTGQWQTDQALTVMQDAMAKTGGEFDGIMVNNEAMLLGVEKALQPSGKTYPIATENGYEETIERIKTDPNLMTVSVPSTSEGEIVFQQVKAYFEGKDFPKFLKCPYAVVDQNTAATVSALPYKDLDAYLALSKEGKTVDIFAMQDSGAENPDWQGMIDLNGSKSK